MCSTEGITEWDKLPQKAQEYLRFIERNPARAIGMISTGPDRTQTIMMPEFEQALNA
jgi:adenylosuccinate synthase